MAQNVDECKSLVADAVTKIGEINTLLQEVKEWANEVEATMAEMIGTESDVFRSVKESSDRAEVAIGLCQNLGVETEYLQEHLSAVS